MTLLASEVTSAAEGASVAAPYGLVQAPIEIALAGLLLVVTYFIIRSHNLFTTVILTGVFSLLCTGIYTLTDAVDVAFTEAAVGAGVSTVLFLGTLSLTGEREAAKRGRPVVATLACLAMGGVLLYGTAEMPAYGDYSAAIHHHVVPRYILESPKEIGLPNFVTSVLASYRGFDTFGETTVVFTAAVGVLLLLRSNWTAAYRRRDAASGFTHAISLENDLRLRTLGRLRRPAKPTTVQDSAPSPRDPLTVPDLDPSKEGESS